MGWILILQPSVSQTNADPLFHQAPSAPDKKYITVNLLFYTFAIATVMLQVS